MPRELTFGYDQTDVQFLAKDSMQTAKELSNAFSNTDARSFKTYGHDWNVEGPTVFSVQNLTEDHYENTRADCVNDHERLAHGLYTLIELADGQNDMVTGESVSVLPTFNNDATCMLRAAVAE